MASKRSLPGFGINNHDGVFVDQAHAKRISEAFDAESSAQACARILTSGVLGSELQLTRDGQVVTLKPVFKAHLLSEWTIFARQALISLLKYGICPVKLATQPQAPFGRPYAKGQEKNRVPVVAEVACCRVKIVEEDYRRTYKLVDDQGEEVPDSHVFVRVEPTCTAHQVCSPMSSLVDDIEFILRMNSFAIDAESVRSRHLITVRAPRDLPTAKRHTHPLTNPCAPLPDERQREVGQRPQPLDCQSVLRPRLARPRREQRRCRERQAL